MGFPQRLFLEMENELIKTGTEVKGLNFWWICGFK